MAVSVNPYLVRDDSHHHQSYPRVNSFSYSYGYAADPQQQHQRSIEEAARRSSSRKNKSSAAASAAAATAASAAASSSSRWMSKFSTSDPEMKRKRRVAAYKLYAVEARLKSSVKKSVRWIKIKCFDLRYGWW